MTDCPAPRLSIRCVETHIGRKSEEGVRTRQVHCTNFLNGHTDALPYSPAFVTLRQALHLLRIGGMTIAAISSTDTAMRSPALQLSLRRLESWICQELKEIRRCAQMTSPISESRKRVSRRVALLPSFLYVVSTLGSIENRTRHAECIDKEHITATTMSRLCTSP